jgi:hypothetical protein
MTQKFIAVVQGWMNCAPIKYKGCEIRQSVPYLFDVYQGDKRIAETSSIKAAGRFIDGLPSTGTAA